MKQLKKMMITLLVATDYTSVWADSVAGKTEISAIELKLGKKKITSGTLKSEYILPKGNYIIQVTPGKVIKSTKKISVTAKFTASKFVDQEPNNTEDTAQTIKAYNSSSYKMYLTSLHLFENQDLTDCMKFTLKDTEMVKITLSSKADMSGVKVLLREKTDNGYNTIKAYEIVNGKLSEKIELKKGTYYIKVWCADDSLERQMPYMIKCAA